METSPGFRYDMGKLKMLEAKALENLSKGVDNLDINLTLLRFYQFQKELMNLEIVSWILSNALTLLPDTQFKLYLHLLPETSQRLEPIASLISLASHLEGARYQLFWQTAETINNVLNRVPDFSGKFRHYILSTISLTFQKISETLLSSYLHLTPQDFTLFIQEKCDTDGWKTVQTPKGQVIILPPKSSSILSSQRNSSSRCVSRAKDQDVHCLVSSGRVDFTQIASLAHGYCES